MSAEEEALLAAIVASPDDDAPRLVYADFLLERGTEFDVDRAKFIIAQCAIASCEQRGDRKSVEYRRARQAERRSLHWSPDRRWPRSLGVDFRGELSRRGFYVEGDLSIEPRHLAYPGLAIDSVELSAYPPTVGELREARELDFPVREIVWHHLRFDARALFALAEGRADDEIIAADEPFPSAPFRDLLTGIELPEFDVPDIELPRSVRYVRMEGEGIVPAMLRDLPALERLEVFGADEHQALAVLAMLGDKKNLRALTLTAHQHEATSAHARPWSREVTDAFHAAGVRPRHLAASFPIDARARDLPLETLVADAGVAPDALSPTLHRLTVFDSLDVIDAAAKLPRLSDLAFVSCDLDAEHMPRLEALCDLTSLAFVECTYLPSQLETLVQSRALAGVPLIHNPNYDLETTIAHRNRDCVL